MESTQTIPKFKIGDKVIFTNDNGAVFPGKTITGIEYWEGHSQPRYFYSPSDTPWFSSREEHFKLSSVETDMDNLPVRRVSIAS